MRKRFCVVIGPKGQLGRLGQRLTMEWEPSFALQYGDAVSEQPTHKAICHQFWRGMPDEVVAQRGRDGLKKIEESSETMTIGSFEFTAKGSVQEGVYRDDFKSHRPHW